MNEIRVNVNSREVERMLEKVQDSLSPTGLDSFFNQRLAPFFRRRVSDRFAGEGDDASGEWAPLSNATVKIRESMGYPGAHPINVRSGSMKEFLEKAQGQTFPSEGATTFVFPGRSPGGKISERILNAQTGENGREKKNPVRPVLAVNPVDLEYAMYALMGYIEDGLV